MLNFKQIFTGGNEQQKEVLSMDNLFAQYKEKQPRATKEEFYNQVVTPVVVDMGLVEDGPMGTSDNKHERYELNIVDLQIGSDGLGTLEYSFARVDENGQEDGYEEGGRIKVDKEKTNKLLEEIQKEIQEEIGSL